VKGQAILIVMPDRNRYSPHNPTAAPKPWRKLLYFSSIEAVEGSYRSAIAAAAKRIPLRATSQAIVSKKSRGKTIQFTF
jgi:hypothetical protein